MGNCYNSSMEIKRKMNKANKIYVSFSGGKDSTAMLIRLLELKQPIDRIIFADTGFEFPELYNYIDRVEKYIQNNFNKSLKIERLKPKESLWSDWFYGKVTRGKNKGITRGFPCWYSRESKIKPLQKEMLDAKIIYIGIASDEIERCSDDDFIKYPLVEWNWTEQDCVDYLNKIELMNPLYTNFNRLGCFFCQKQNDMSLWVLWKTHPKLWKKAKYWDEESRKISNHGIKELKLSEYEKKFEEGWTPKQLPKYECFSCNAVGSAFKIRQEKLNVYFREKQDGGNGVPPNN